MNQISLAILLYLLIFVICQPKRGNDRQDRARRMIGGRRAIGSQWSLAVFLEFLQPEAPFQVCTGSLIRNEWILTAAHCVEDIKNQPQYLLATIQKLSDQTEVRHSFGVSKIVVHKMFTWKFKLLPPNTFSWDFDIALIKLNDSVPDAWTIAKLPAKESNVTDCKSAGWGSTRALKNFNDSQIKNYKISKTLQEIDVPIVAWSKCHDYYSDHKTFAQSNFKVFCGGKRQRNDTVEVGGCIGDSGSPLLCQDKQNDMVIFGIMLGGHPLCKTKENYMIFTKVSEYLSWIEQTTK